MEGTIESEKNKSLFFISRSDDDILELVSATHCQEEDNTSIADLHTLSSDTEEILGGAFWTLYWPEIYKYPEVSFRSSLWTTIKSIGLEVSLYEEGGGDETMSLLESRTLQLLEKLSKYSWEAKLVMVLASFALEYVQSDLLNKSIAILKQGDKEKDHPIVNALQLMTKTLELVDDIFGQRSSSLSASPPKPFINEMTGVEIPVQVYWLIAITVACATQIKFLTCQEGNKAHDLSQLSEKLRHLFVYQDAERLLSSWQEEKVDENNYQGVFLSPSKIQSASLRGNLAEAMAVFKALILANSTAQTILIDGSTNQPVDMDVLRWKNLLLVFSGLDISDADDVSPLKLIYKETKQEDKYKIVWIPVVESWTQDGQKRFEELKSKMPWYIVQCSSPLATAIRFIKKEWKFKGEPILVVMSSSGTVKNTNALPLIRKEGMKAFPFHQQHNKKQSRLGMMF